MAYLTVCVLLLFAIFDFGSAIMCYECNSSTNPQCEGNQLPASLMRNCSELDRDRGVRHTLCRKIVQHVDYGGVNGQLPTSRVVRACGWDDSKYKGSCYHQSGYGGRQEVCSCTRDFCNGSRDLRGTITLSIVSTITLIQARLLANDDM